MLVADGFEKRGRREQGRREEGLQARGKGHDCLSPEICGEIRVVGREGNLVVPSASL